MKSNSPIRDIIIAVVVLIVWIAIVFALVFLYALYNYLWALILAAVLVVLSMIGGLSTIVYELYKEVKSRKFVKNS